MHLFQAERVCHLFGQAQMPEMDWIERAPKEADGRQRAQCCRSSIRSLADPMRSPGPASQQHSADVAEHCIKVGDEARALSAVNDPMVIG